MRNFYRHIWPILQYLLLAAALIWTLWFVFAGFGNHMDPPYWLYKYRHLDGGWMSAGTLLFGHLCVSLFGANLLALRLVGWGMTVLAIALPYGLLLSPIQRRQHIHWLALAYAMMGYGAFQELSPGTLTVFLLSVLSTLCLLYLRRPSVWQAAVIGLIVGLAIAARFPNVLVIIPIAVLFYLSPKRMDGLVALTTTILGAALIYGLSAILLTYSSVDPAMGGSHGLSKMLTKLWERGAVLLGLMALWYGVWSLGKRSWYWAIPAAFGMAYFAFYVLKPEWYNIDLTYCVASACIILALASHNRSLLWMLAILPVATLGTDVAWLKLFPAVLILIPLIPTAYQAKMRAYLYVVLLGLVAVQAPRLCTNSIGKADLTTSTVRASVQPYQGLYIDSVNNARIVQLQADAQHYSPIDSVLAVGQDLHLIRSVTGCRAGVYNEFWSNTFDSVYTAKYQPVIIERQPVVFCSFSPHFKVKKTYIDKHSAFEQMLLRNGYTAIDRSAYQYMIYVPDSTTKKQ